MAQEFHCHCYNVRISVEENNVIEADSEIQDLRISDKFFSDVSAISATNEVIINKTIQYLCHLRQINEWKINFCLSCGMDTHATSISNQKSHQILISRSLERNSSVCKLNEMKDYSPLYNIVIGKSATITSKESNLCIPQSVLHQSLEELKEHTLQLLNAENEMVLERIRNFELEQLAYFAELQTRTQQDQNTLMQTLMSYRERDNNLQKKCANPSSPLTHSEQRDTPKYNLNIQGVASSLTKDSIDDDIIFAMDEDEATGCTNGKHSDRLEPTEHLPVDTDEDNDDDIFANPENKSQLYATSLPISMPGKWCSPQAQQEVTEDPDFQTGTEQDDDPQWIAANIKALAMSVRGNDGTEMFGARPRPRLNTMD